MTAEITIRNPYVNGGVAMTLCSAKVEETSDSAITQISIPEMNSASKPNTALLNMKSVNSAIIITGYICKNSTFTSPFAEKECLKELQYNNQSVCTLSIRDGSYTNAAGEEITYQYTGYVKKVSLVDSYSGDFSELVNGDAVYEMQVMFLIGVDIVNMGS